MQLANLTSRFIDFQSHAGYSLKRQKYDLLFLSLPFCPFYPLKKTHTSLNEVKIHRINVYSENQ